LKIKIEIFKYRDLIRNLTMADLKNHYQNTSLGFFWSILSPLCLTFVMYFVFRQVYGGERNFGMNLFVGVMVWRFFNMGTSTCLTTIVGKPNLITKVFLPRHVLVLSTALSSLFVSSLEFLILLPIGLLLLGYIPLTFCLYPIVHLLLFMPIYGIGLIWASAYVYFRDLTQIWELALAVLIYSCPIIYPISIVPQYLLKYYMLNPLTQFIIIYRNILVEGRLPNWDSLLIVIVFGILTLIAGNFIFNKLQRRFAEEL
jgi:lipopolysaccharide transport system permease protein